MKALDQVLACRSLPTLPAIAVEMLRLMRDESTTLKQIAKLVRSDQGLATKVLRTVNSPLYGLRQPCRSIDRALAYLGQNAVKSIVLGFSLMESVRDTALGDGFDLDAYWKRVIYSAAAARQAAQLTGACDADEAFTGGLFQDMGMLAMATVFGERYGSSLHRGPHCHLPRREKEEFGFDHTEAGAALGERWRLPEQTLQCVRRHHDPEAAAAGHPATVQCVALGSMLASELLAPEEERRLAKLAQAIIAWFGPGTLDLPELVRRATADAGSLAVVFDQSMEAPADLEAILAEAHDQLVQHQVSVAREAQTRLEESLTDALTGGGNRRSFDQSLEGRFAEATRSSAALTAMFIDVDHFKVINDRYGHAVGDAALVELAVRMTAALGTRGALFRYGGEEFAVLAPGLAADDAVGLADEVRQAVAAAPVDLRGLDAGAQEALITISAGVATHSLEAPYATAAALMRAADEALYVAKRAGRNRVSPASRSNAPPEAAASAPALRVLLIEDDSLAAAVIRARLARRPEVLIQWERTRAGAAAYVAACQEGTRPLPDIILCDLFLDGNELGTDVIRAVRACGRLAHVPVWAISASDDAADVAACMAAGATAFRSKQTIVGSLSAWINEVVASARAAA
jgi:two-component system cell cycle response regulator